MTIENAGHAQIFDVEQSQKEDLIILNYFVNKIKLTKNALEKNNGVGSSKNISLDKENENSYGTAYSNFYEEAQLKRMEKIIFKEYLFFFQLILWDFYLNLLNRYKIFGFK